MSWTEIEVAVGASTVAVTPYVTRLYEVVYEHEGTSFVTFARVFLPDASALADVEEIGLVALVEGVGGKGATGTERTDRDRRYRVGGDLAGQAPSADATLPDRDCPPLVVVAYNNPGTGDSDATLSDGTPHFDLSADGNPDMDFGGPFELPPEANGLQDVGGPMSAAALTEAIRTALDVILDEYGVDSDDVRVILASFSNGLPTAARVAAEDPRCLGFRVHALVDGEGPVDGLEQSMSTECFDPLGEYAYDGVTDSDGNPCPAISGEIVLTHALWRDGVTLHDDCGGGGAEAGFCEAFGAFYHPPADLQAELDVIGESALGTSDVPCAGDVTILPDFWSRVFDRDYVAEFWEPRQAELLLPERRAPFVRWQSEADHVQPEHYSNRHAMRALFAASETTWISPEHAYYVGTPGGDPVEFDPSSFDLDDPSTWPSWPLLSISSPPTRIDMEIDTIRWAYLQDFSYASITTWFNPCRSSLDDVVLRPPNWAELYDPPSFDFDPDQYIDWTHILEAIERYSRPWEVPWPEPIPVRPWEVHGPLDVDFVLVEERFRDDILRVFGEDWDMLAERLQAELWSAVPDPVRLERVAGLVAWEELANAVPDEAVTRVLDRAEALAQPIDNALLRSMLLASGCVGCGGTS